MKGKCKETINAVVIGASKDSIYAIKKAKNMNIMVFALDGNAKAEGLKYADKSIVVDIDNIDEIYRVLDQLTPDVVVPVPIGRYLTSIGAVNDCYGLRGISQKAANLCTDKHSFHSVLSQNQMRHAEHILISRGDTCDSICIDKLNFPVVVKPRYGSGSRAVMIYGDANELKNSFFASLPLDEDFVVEDFINGTEYGVDAAIINGNLNLILLREKLQTPYPYCQCVGYFSVVKHKENVELFNAVEKSLNDVVQILGLDSCLLHADLIYNEGNDVFIVELSARPSGHNLYNIFTPMATGIDMISEYLKFALPRLKKNHSFVPRYTEHMLIRYFSLAEGRVARIPDWDKLCSHYPIEAFECNIRDGMVLGKVTDGHSLMERGFFIIKGSNKRELMDISSEIESFFVIE